MSVVALIDPERIAMLASTMPDVAGRIVDLFEQVTPGELTELLAAPDAEAVSRAAHKIKGSCQNVGAAAMAELCADLERSPGGHAERAERLVALLPGTVAELRSVLA